MQTKHFDVQLVLNSKLISQSSKLQSVRPCGIIKQRFRTTKKHAEGVGSFQRLNGNSETFFFQGTERWSKDDNG